MRVLAQRLGLGFVDLGEATVDTAEAQSIPEELARRYCVLPLSFSRGVTGRNIAPARASAVSSDLVENHLHFNSPHELACSKRHYRRATSLVFDFSPHPASLL